MLQRYMDMGGPLMWPLLVCSVLLGAVLNKRRFHIPGWLYRKL